MSVLEMLAIVAVLVLGGIGVLLYRLTTQTARQQAELVQLLRQQQQANGVQDQQQLQVLQAQHTETHAAIHTVAEQLVQLGKVQQQQGIAHANLLQQQQQETIRHLAQLDATLRETVDLTD